MRPPTMTDLSHRTPSDGVAVLLAAALALAAASGAAAFPIEIELAKHAQVGIFPVSSATVAPFLPDGFAPVFAGCSNPGAVNDTCCPQAAGPPGADAVIQFVGSSFTWADNPAGPDVVESIIAVWVYADPPDELEDPGLGPWGLSPYPYLVVPQIAVTSPAIAAAFQSIGIPAVAATITHEVTGVDSGATVTSTMTVNDGVSEWMLTTPVPDDFDGPEGAIAERLRYFGVDGGGALGGIMDFDEGPHRHSPDDAVPPPGTTFTILSGTPVFPTPSQAAGAGLGILSLPGFTQTFLPVTDTLPAIFADTFDAGLEEPAWDRVHDPQNHLTGAAAPGLGCSASALAVSIDESAPGVEEQHFVLDRSPDGIRDYRAEFLLKPNAAAITGRVKTYAARGDDGDRLLRLMLRENPTGDPPYQIRFSALNDAGKWVNLPWAELGAPGVAADAEFRIALSWRQGTGAGDGSFRLYVNGRLVGERIAFNNDDRSLGAHAIGNLGLFKTGTLATSPGLGWDDFKSFGSP